MQYGVCGTFDLAPVAQACGFDYLESSVESVLKPAEPAAAFEAVLRTLDAMPLPCPVLNCLVPGRLKLVGPQVDQQAIAAYAATVFQRAHRAGVQILVFGSGAARRIPDGWDHLEAWSQLVAFGRLLASLGAEHGVVVTVEPLNRQETNILNTVSEAAALVRAVDHPSVRLLVDAYHWLLDGDSAEDIVAHGGLLAHAHIATSPKRLPPGAEPCDLASFFDALARAGYTGRLSFEGAIADPVLQLPPALALMHRLEREAARDV